MPHKNASKPKVWEGMADVSAENRATLRRKAKETAKVGDKKMTSELLKDAAAEGLKERNRRRKAKEVREENAAMARGYSKHK